MLLEAAVSGWDVLTSSPSRVLQEVTSMLRPSYVNMEVSWNHTTPWHVNIMVNMKSVVSVCTPAYVSGSLAHFMFTDLPGLPVPFPPKKSCFRKSTSEQPTQTEKLT